MSEDTARRDTNGAGQAGWHTDDAKDARVATLCWTVALLILGIGLMVFGLKGV